MTPGHLLALGLGLSFCAFPCGFAVASTPLLQLQRGHSSLVTALAFDPDGQMLASMSREGQIKVWHADTFSLLRNIEKKFADPLAPETSIVARLAACRCAGQPRLAGVHNSEPGVIRVWDLFTGELVAERRSQDDRQEIKALVFSPDGCWVITAEGDQIRAWRIAGDSKAASLASAPTTVCSLAFAASAGMLAAGLEDGRICVWKVQVEAEGVKAMQPPREIQADSFSVTSVDFTDDGTWLASGSSNGLEGRVGLWDPVTGKSRMTEPLASLKPLNREVNVIDFEGVIGAEEETVRVDQVLLDFQRGTTRLAYAGGLEMRQWDVGAKAELSRTELRHKARCVQFAPNRELLAVGISDDPGFDSQHRRVDLPDRGGYDIVGLKSPEGEEIRRIAGQKAWVHAIVVSPKGRKLVAGSIHNQTLDVWDLEHGQATRLPGTNIGASVDAKLAPGRAIWVNSVALNHGESILAAADGDKSIRLLDPATLMPLVDKRNLSGQPGADSGRLRGHRNFIISLDFNPDDTVLASGSEDTTIRLWRVHGDAPSEQETKDLNQHSGYVTAVKFHPNREQPYLASSDSNGTILIWDLKKLYEALAAGRKILDVETPLVGRIPEAHRGGVISLRFSRDGKWLASCGKEDGVRLWDFAKLLDAQSPQPYCTLAGHTGVVYAMAFHPQEERLLATAGQDRRILLWDLPAPGTGTEVKPWLELAGHDWTISSLTFTSNGNHLISGSFDGTIKIWSVARGKISERHLCTLATLDPQGTADPDSTPAGGAGRAAGDVAWAVVDPQGRYDAVNGGATDGMHWVFQNEPIGLEQLKERYYEPRLLAKILGYDEEPLRRVEAFDDPALYPTVAVSEPTATDGKYRIELTDRGGGIGPVLVKIDGKEITHDARQLEENKGRKPENGKWVLTVDLTGDKRLQPGARIEVQAFNEQGYLRSRGVRSVYQADQANADPKPRIWAIVAGVADYRGTAIDLRFADKDAEDFAQALRLAATDYAQLIGAEAPQIRVLSTRQKKAEDQPTRENIRREFLAAQDAKPDDIFLAYLSGHGVNHQGVDSDYYFLTMDADSANLNDPAMRQHTAISSSELTEWMKQVPARSTALVLDTCASGRFIEQLSGARHGEVSSEQIRALQRMKDRSGFWILAGCAGDRVSYEANRFAQGLLTYSLLFCLKRGEGLKENRFVNVAALFERAADEVPRWAADIGGSQRPVLASPGPSHSFDFGMLDESRRTLIPLEEIRPVVVRSSFQEENQFVDAKQLGTHVNRCLMRASFDQAGDRETLVYIEADEFPDAYQLVGRYRIGENGNLKVNVKLARGGTIVAEPDELREIQGTVEDIEPLAEEIVARVRRALTQLHP